MNREIKFRAWQKKPSLYREVGMYDVQSICWYGKSDTDGYTGVVFFKGYKDSEYLEDVVLQQFTGLLDKNGKEIYEGDRVRYKDRGNWVEGVVKYHKSSFCIRQSQEIYTGMDYLMVEVIGNIHDQAEK